MRICIQNIGKIKFADVEIDGITVVAGENDTGKSTIGKTLFSMFHSFYDFADKISSERILSVEKKLENLYTNARNLLTVNVDFFGMAEEIVTNISLYKNNEKKLKNAVLGMIIQYDKTFERCNETPSVDENIKRIFEILNISDDDILKTVIEKQMRAEFNSQMNNIYSGGTGKIKLQIGNESAELEIEDNTVKSFYHQIDLRTEAVYIDDPFVLSKPEQKTLGFFWSGFHYLYDDDHRKQLKKKLFIKSNSNLVDEIAANQKIKKITNKLNQICGGNIVSTGNNNDVGYLKKDSHTILDLRNLSMGLKTFIIIKILLENGSIEYNGTVILDEPEIHLHPEWQLILAETIVLIQKEFGVHILLNTHSPYFLNAIEVYAAKYGIADKCKYYVAMPEKEETIISDVTDNIEVIYKKLARPLQDLENMRYSND